LNTKINYKSLQTNQALKQACEHLATQEWIGLDIETTELDPFDGELRLIQLSDKTDTYVIDLRQIGDLDPLREFLGGHSRKVIHNAKFDAKWIKHHLGVELGGVFCTMIASQLLAAGDTHRRHGLKDIAEYFLGIEVDKTEQASDWGKEELDQAQLEYAAKDAAVLLPLKDKIWEQLELFDLVEVAELENECVVPVLQMELNGFKLDKQAWQDQLYIVNAHALAKHEELQQLFGKYHPQQNLLGKYNINLNSPQQVTAALRWCGVPVKDSTEEWKLQPLAKDHPVVDVMLDYRGLSKAQTSYGLKWFEHIHPVTGRVHADYDQTRAKTGRFGCSNPNMQQIPAESAYRQCFKAEPGNKLIIADYSQIELRILAYKSQDELFISAFNSGQDFHTTTASQVFDVPLYDVTPDQRSFAKRLNFGLVYGIGAKKFAMLTGVTQVEADDIMEKYFGTYTGLNMYLRDAGRQAVVDRSCRTESGRLMKLRFDEKDKWAVREAMRYGVNMPIQGTSADILKRALRLLHEAIRGTSARLVNIVHDEIIVECAEEDAPWAAKKLEEVMTRAGEEYISGVPVTVSVGVSDEWAK
jgi:DNA polymerase-1